MLILDSGMDVLTAIPEEASFRVRSRLLPVKVEFSMTKLDPPSIIDPVFVDPMMVTPSIATVDPSSRLIPILLFSKLPPSIMQSLASKRRIPALPDPEMVLAFRFVPSVEDSIPMKLPTMTLPCMRSGMESSRDIALFVPVMVLPVMAAVDLWLCMPISVSFILHPLVVDVVCRSRKTPPSPFSYTKES